MLNVYSCVCKLSEFMCVCVRLHACVNSRVSRSSGPGCCPAGQGLRFQCDLLWPLFGWWCREVIGTTKGHHTTGEHMNTHTHTLTETYNDYSPGSMKEIISFSLFPKWSDILKGEVGHCFTFFFAMKQTKVDDSGLCFCRKSRSCFCSWCSLILRRMPTVSTFNTSVSKAHLSWQQ